jgi:hypothetical protein
LETRRSPLTVDLSRIAFADVGGYRAMEAFSCRCAADGLVNFWAPPSGPVRLLWDILGVPGGALVE